jgi:sterol 3beta-glucosyltransferase
VSTDFESTTGVFAVPGYTLKGIERTLHKRRLTPLKAEVILIRMRQMFDEVSRSTDEERETVVRRWKETLASHGK